MKGSYLLVIELSEGQDIRVGSLGVVRFQAGYYVYVGSALGGFKSRLNRHLRKDKKSKWHIDYLLQKADIKSVIICETEERVECAIAKALSRRFDSISDFGSSDCRCPSHLFFADVEMEREIMKILNSLGLKPRVFDSSKRV